MSFTLGVNHLIELSCSNQTILFHIPSIASFHRVIRSAMSTGRRPRVTRNEWLIVDICGSLVRRLVTMSVPARLPLLAPSFDLRLRWQIIYTAVVHTDGSVNHGSGNPYSTLYCHCLHCMHCCVPRKQWVPSITLHCPQLPLFLCSLLFLLLHTLEPDLHKC